MTHPVKRSPFLILGAILALSGRPGSGQVSAPPAGAVEGRASLEGKDPGQARELALEQAFRSQVIARVASRLPDKVRTGKQKELEAAIYSHSQDYIRRYQIVAEQTEGAEYVVYLELEVAEEILDAALARGGFLSRPRPAQVFLLVLEQVQGGPAESWWKSAPNEPAKPSFTEQVLSQELAGHGYAVIQPLPGRPRVSPEKVTNPGAEREQVLRQIQKDFHADLLLVGKASTRTPEGKAMTQAELALAGVDLASQETLFRLERTAESPRTEAGKSAGQALTLAARSLAPELFQKLSAKGPPPAEAARAFDLFILNVFAYPVYQAVNERLSRPIPGVKAVELRSLSPGRLIFRVTGSIEAEALAKLLLAESFPGFHLEKIEVTPDHIRLTATALPGAGALP